ncbi:MAG: hypothetical protein ACOYMN_23645 [Roseimicrobium sp.]
MKSITPSPSAASPGERGKQLAHLCIGIARLGQSWCDAGFHVLAEALAQAAGGLAQCRGTFATRGGECGKSVRGATQDVERPRPGSAPPSTAIAFRDSSMSSIHSPSAHSTNGDDGTVAATPDEPRHHGRVSREGALVAPALSRFALGLAHASIEVTASTCVRTTSAEQIKSGSFQ